MAVSRADNKKEAGPDGKEFGHTTSQELVCGICANLIREEPVKQDSGSKTEVRNSKHVDNDTNLENKSSVPTPTHPPLTLGTGNSSK